MIQKLVRTALEEAQRRGGRLTAIDIRLGALAGGSASHLREHFEHEIEQLGVGPVELRITEIEHHPAGVEITGIEYRA